MEVKEEASVLLAISLCDSICVYTYCAEYMFRLNMEGDCRWRRQGHISQSASAPCISEHYRKHTYSHGHLQKQKVEGFLFSSSVSTSQNLKYKHK